MLTNLVSFVPRILLDIRMDGALLSIMIGVPIGLILLFFFMKALFKFPGKTEPEILLTYTPKWFSVPYILLTGAIWYIAGLILILMFIDITKRYINPDMSSMFIALMCFLLISFGSVMKSRKVLFSLELILLSSIPAILLVVFKAVSTPNLSTDAMRIVFTHVTDAPTFLGISAVTFIFMGFNHMAIFNREFDSNTIKSMRFSRIITTLGVIGLTVVTVILFIPIGILGFDSVSDFLYPLISSSDALSMQYGFIERVIFVFLFFHIGLSLIAITVTWHVGIEIFRHVLPHKEWKGRNITTIFILTLFGLILFITSSIMNFKQIHMVTSYFLFGFVIVSLFATVLLTFIAKKVTS